MDKTGHHRWLAMGILCLGALMIVLDVTIVNVALPSIRADLHTALYMQRVLGFTPMKIGIAFVPANLVMAACSISLSAKLVMRFGVRGLLAAGLIIGARGLAWFTRTPLSGKLIADVLPGMLLLGVGGGIAFNPMRMAAMSEVGHTESGLASGVVNTAFLLGGALGLAVLASVAAARSDGLLANGASQVQALADGYQAAFGAGAAFALVAAVLGGVWIRRIAPAAAAPSI